VPPDHQLRGGDPATASLREQHAELTRELILRALAELLQNGHAAELSVQDVARSAGVSLRTVYRHFQTREELFGAVADWIDWRIFGDIPLDETAEDLPKRFKYACDRWDEHPRLAYAMALSQAGRSDRSHWRLQRLAAIRRALTEVTNQLPEQERRKAVAVLGYLENVLAWVTMRDVTGLDGRNVGEAVEWAMRTLIEDLRRRNIAAGRVGEGATRLVRAG
jgi:AcrR family transcriptional regulator